MKTATKSDRAGEVCMFMKGAIIERQLKFVNELENIILLMSTDCSSPLNI